jgi:hypothetical protein
VVDVGRHVDDAVSDARRFGPLATGGEENFGRGGVRVFFEEVMLGCPDVVVADAVGEFDLIECVLEELVLGVRRPGARELVFVEAAEFHDFLLCSVLLGLERDVVERKA